MKNNSKKISMIFWKTKEGHVVEKTLTESTHLLIAGLPSTGKSTLLNPLNETGAEKLVKSGEAYIKCIYDNSKIIFRFGVELTCRV